MLLFLLNGLVTLGVIVLLKLSYFWHEMGTKRGRLTESLLQFYIEFHLSFYEHSLKVQYPQSKPSFSSLKTAAIVLLGYCAYSPRQKMQSFCCQLQIQTMNGRQAQSRQVHTRSSARMFGLDLTNRLPERPSDPKRRKNDRPKHSLSSHWLASLPEVHPYLNELQLHARNQEHEGYICEDFMAWRAEITASMREILVGWMMEMHSHLCNNAHTLYLAVLITDKFCLGRSVPRQQYQLLGIAALFVAAKYEQIKTPKLKQYFNVCGGAFSMEQILAMESEILLSLNFRVKAMTTCWHLEESLQFASISPQGKSLSLYLLDLSLIEYAFCLLRPSLLGWAIVLFAVRSQRMDLNELDIASAFHLEPAQLREVGQLVESLYGNRKHQKFRTVNEKHLPRMTSPAQGRA